MATSARSGGCHCGAGRFEADLPDNVTINAFDGQNWEANAGALAHKSRD